MNYFAHAIRYLDRPYFICGVSVPDWLNVVNRRCRVRRKRLEAVLPELSGDRLEIATGILQHLDDDHWFHGTVAFFELNNHLAIEFRRVLGETGDWHCGVLAHIVVELLIDSWLIERHPDLITRYYQNFHEIDPMLVEEVVSALATVPAENLGRLIPRFVDERFLIDYTSNSRLLLRLNQVMKRIGLSPLPESVFEVFDQGRALVDLKISQLLKSEDFTEITARPEPAPFWTPAS